MAEMRWQKIVVFKRCHEYFKSVSDILIYGNWISLLCRDVMLFSCIWMRMRGLAGRWFSDWGWEYWNLGM